MSPHYSIDFRNGIYSLTTADWRNDLVGEQSFNANRRVLRKHKKGKKQKDKTRVRPKSHKKPKVSKHGKRIMRPGLLTDMWGHG